MTDVTCSFTIDARAVPKERPRVGPHGGWTPGKTRRWEEVVGWHARAGMRGQRIMPGGLEVEMRVELRGHGGGDVDNYAKAVLDGMQGIVYADDRQVRRLVAETVPGCDTDRLEVTVRPWPRT